MVMLAAAGVGLSAYLLQAHLTVLSGGLEEGFFCSGAGVWDCNAVAAHESASFLGLPVAMWGLLYFALELGLAIEALFLREEDLKAVCALGTNLCTLGLLFDGYLGFVMVPQIRHVCLSCAGTSLINLLLMLGFWRRERAIDAPVTVAVTGDFQCSFCRWLANHLEALRRRYPGKIRLIFVNFPVSSECNPNVHERVHEDACWLARAGECAAAQGRFWEYHDLAFQRIGFASVRRENVLRRIGEAGVDPRRLRAWLETPAPAEAVAEDIALLKTLR